MNMRLSDATLPEEAWTSARKRSRWLVVVAIIIVVAGLAGALWYFLNARNTHSQRQALPTVVVAIARSADVTVTEHAIGTVVAASVVQVTAQVTGQILKADFKEGQIVRDGQLLFEIDPKPFEAALQQARAQLAKDAAQLMSAQKDRRRYAALFAKHAASSQQRDQTEAAAKALAASVEADRAAVQVAALNLGYTSIRSPITGKTGPILIQPGNLVTANSTNPIVVLTQIQPVKVSFALPQSDLPQIQEREQSHRLVANLDTHETGGTPLSAQVDFVSNQVSTQTGTIELRATFDNQDSHLVPGQMIDLNVTLGTLKAATVVPREAVNDGPTGRYAFVVSPDDTAQMRPVTVLFDDGANSAVSGVRPGEKVIIDGQLRVLPGTRVSVRERTKAGVPSRPTNVR